MAQSLRLPRHLRPSPPIEPPRGGSPSPRGRLGYVASLDGIRGLAVAGVVSRHLFGLPFGGGLGVDLFFVLSGFLITTLLLEEVEATGRASLRSFYVRRARRLLPALCAMLLFYLLVSAFSRHALLLAGVAISYWPNLYSAYVHSLDSGPFSHLWSLGEEEQFYLLWPIALVFLLRRRRALAPILATIFVFLVAYRATLVSLGFEHHRIYMSPDTHADGLVLGCLVAVARLRQLRLPRLGTPAFVFVLLAFLLRDVSPLWDAAGLPLFELAAACLIADALRPSQVSDLFSRRPLVRLGGISYSLYVWHMPIWWLFGFSHPVPALMVSLAVSMASYRYIEQPFRRRRAVPEGRRVPSAPAADLTSAS